MGAPPAAKKSNTVLIIVIVVIVVVGLVVAGTLLALSAFNHAVDQTSDVSMTGASTRTPAASEYSMAPGTGMTYVQVTVTITNKADIPTAISDVWFQLQASGTKYTFTPYVNTDTYSTTMPVGGSVTFKVSFEIPSTAIPQKIIYNPILGHSVSADL